MDLAHEALITAWPALVNWIAELREAEQTRRRLQSKVDDWIRLGQDSGGLLDGVQLLEAEQWLSGNPAAHIGYDQALLQLVQSSRQAIERSEAEKAKAHALALETARKLAETERSRGDIEKHARLRQRHLSLVLAVLLLVVLAAVVLLWRQNRISNSRAVAAAALTQLSVDPELSMLLGIESARYWHTREAQDALRLALAESYVSHTFRGHTDRIVKVIFDHKGDIVTGSWDGSVRIWDATTGKVKAILKGNASRIWDMAISPDDMSLATAGQDDTVRVWDLASDRESLVLRGHSAPVESVAYSPDGRLLISAAGCPFPSGTCDTAARIWNASTGQLVGTVGNHIEGLSVAMFSPDGRMVPTAGPSGLLELWDASGINQLASLECGPGMLRHVEFSANSQRVLSANDGAVCVWETETGSRSAVLEGHTDWILSARFSPDSKQVVTASADGTAQIWSLATKYSIVLRGHTSILNDAIFDGSGERIATASRDGTVVVWDAKTGAMLQVLRGHKSDVTNVAFSPDGKSLLTGSDDATARLWRAELGASIAEFGGHSAIGWQASFSSDSTQVTTTDHGTLKTWDVKSGAQLSVRTSEGAAVNEIAATADGRLRATVDRVGTVEVRATESGERLASMQGHGAPPTLGVFSPDGHLLVTAVRCPFPLIECDEPARVWDVESGRELVTLAPYPEGVSALGFSPDGIHVATMSGNGVGWLWKLPSGQKVGEFRGHRSFINSVAFSPDARLIVTASGDYYALTECRAGQHCYALGG